MVKKENKEKSSQLEKVALQIEKMRLGDYINNNPCSKYTDSIYYFLCALFF